jgi:hypothetical protein
MIIEVGPFVSGPVVDVWRKLGRVADELAMKPERAGPTAFSQPHLETINLERRSESGKLSRLIGYALSILIL